MPKQIIKRFIPSHEKIRGHKHLKFLGPLLKDPNLLHLNRRSVSGAFAVGLFVAWMPVPLQMILSALAAVVFRVNLPISVTVVWVTNPITMTPMFYFAYKIGSWTLGLAPRKVEFELSIEWINHSLGLIWQPFLLGCLISGTISAVAGYFIINQVWRAKVIQNWNERKAKRKTQ